MFDRQRRCRWPSQVDTQNSPSHPAARQAPVLAAEVEGTTSPSLLPVTPAAPWAPESGPDTTTCFWPTTPVWGHRAPVPRRGLRGCVCFHAPRVPLPHPRERQAPPTPPSAAGRAPRGAEPSGTHGCPSSRKRVSLKATELWEGPLCCTDSHSGHEKAEAQRG